MANSAEVREAFDTLVAENWSNEVISTLFNKMPIMQVLFGRNGEKKEDVKGLGVPDSGLLLSGMKGARTKRKEILSGMIYQPFIHHLLPTEADGKVLGTHDSSAVRSSWETNGPEKRFVRPVVKWVDLEDPCKVSNERLDHTKRAAANERNGWESIGSLLKVESSDVLGIHARRWNQLFWGTYSGAVASTTGAPSDESDEKWDAIHSVANAISASNTYCGVDRTASGNSYWHGHKITTATAPVFRELIRNANYSSTIGLAKKTGPLDCMFVGGDLFSTALSEADAKTATIVSAGKPIPGLAQFGFENDTIRIDNTWIIYDPEAPAGYVFGCKPRTWTVAIYPGANFAQSTPTDQSSIEGGDKAHTWNIRTKLMLVCEAPSENVLWTNVG